MIHVESLALVVALGGAWVVGWRAVRGARRWPAARALAFGAGLLALTAAVNGPLHDFAERSFVSAHMVQHLVLVLVVAPLLLAGLPAELIDPLLAPRGLRAVVAWATHPPIALAIYSAALVAWHLPGPYALTLSSDAWHVTAHVTMLAAAVVAWWPVAGASRSVPALPYAAQILYLFAFGIPMTVVAAMITGAETLLYPSASPTPLQDQRLGGVLMWVPAGIVPLVAFTIVFFRWAAAEAEDVTEYPK